MTGIAATRPRLRILGTTISRRLVAVLTSKPNRRATRVRCNEMNSNPTLGYWGLHAISLGFVALGLWTFLSPFMLGVETAVKTYDLLLDQAALIPLRPHPRVHVAIMILFPLFAIVVGLLGLARIKAGWWGMTVLGSFGAVLFSSAFFKSYVLDDIIRYGDFFAVSIVEINFLVRALIYSVIFIFMFRDESMKAFGLLRAKKLSVVSIVMIANAILAIFLYDFVK